MRAVKTLIDNFQMCHRCGKGERGVVEFKRSVDDHIHQITGETELSAMGGKGRQPVFQYAITDIHLIRNCS